jgi:hypothetical protein
VNNAQAIFDGLEKYSDIQKLLGRQEDIFLDFKERDPQWASPDKMADNEKRLLSKATSGFAHQEGGVLVWGIEARKDSNGVDQAKTLKPFKKVKQFKQSLQENIKFATEPIVDGIIHRAVFVNDHEAGDEGFVVSYFPKSNGVHRALNSTTADFYKRHGDSFTPLSTEDVRALFFRIRAPDLEFILKKDSAARTSPSTTVYPRTVGLKNIGIGVARFISMYLGFANEAGIWDIHWYDGDGGQNFKIGKMVHAPDYEKRGQHFILNGDIPIYPGQSMMLFGFSCVMAESVPLPLVKVRVYAENMAPKDGEIA